MIMVLWIVVNYGSIETDEWLELQSHPGNSRWFQDHLLLDVIFTLRQRSNKSQLYNDLLRLKIGGECGCIDESAINYDSSANIDDNSCCYVSGCMDQSSLNYDSTACYDDLYFCTIRLYGFISKILMQILKQLMVALLII